MASSKSRLSHTPVDLELWQRVEVALAKSVAKKIYQQSNQALLEVPTQSPRIEDPSWKQHECGIKTIYTIIYHNQS